MCINDNVPLPEDDDVPEDVDFGMYHENENNEIEAMDVVNRNAELTLVRRIQTNLIRRYFS